jgi:hypothetical protein
MVRVNNLRLLPDNKPSRDMLQFQNAMIARLFENQERTTANSLQSDNSPPGRKTHKLS